MSWRLFVGPRAGRDMTESYPNGIVKQSSGRSAD